MTTPEPAADLSDEERVALWRAFSNGEDLPWLPQGPQDAHWTAAVDRMLAALSAAGRLTDPDVYADNQRLRAERDNAVHQQQALQNQVDSLVREVRRLQHAERRASRHATERDKDVAEADAFVAARDAEIARFNAREATLRLELHDAKTTAEDLRAELDQVRAQLAVVQRDRDTFQETARRNKRHVAVLTELLERVEKYADRLATYCSHGGVATRYAAELRAELTRPTEAERHTRPEPTSTGGQQ